MIGAAKAALRRDTAIDRARPRRLVAVFWTATLLDALTSGPLTRRALPDAALADTALADIALVDIAFVDIALTEIALLLGVLPTFTLPACALLTVSLAASALPAAGLANVAFATFVAFAALASLATVRLGVAASAPGTDSVKATSAVTRKEALRFKVFPNATKMRNRHKPFRGHHNVTSLYRKHAQDQVLAPLM